MMRLLYVVMTAVLLAACATDAEIYEEALNSFVGTRESALIEKLGAPDSSYVADGGAKYLTYQKTKSSIFLPSGGSQGVMYHRQCKTTFQVVDGVVKSWRYEGNSCTP